MSLIDYIKDTNRRCKTCDFFVGYSNYGGYCYRHAPVLNERGSSSWPYVGPGDVCGDWQDLGNTKAKGRK